ncbi:MAG TPA: 4-(cytidine 5'-diphospho)-2-C-methyl-D-erythritol kinase [Spirochaetota bacterium]|mgnify:FL=1|nr:MAG: 4-diphosphocytidyl-2-C-methyl-D-erythritol kinase [Spirochaetes bacterium ADurb.Bin133]HNZ27915.1 4-(cytidine 5'-diphospho)-2-C-methyl-D-erythritol kinase [Spirochaetota bacterium]HPY86397.1 4-(cytidine 5'-diphospho)-2-C-methyl-D-erythritol kinase [Spirochaetota bacterium]
MKSYQSYSKINLFLNVTGRYKSGYHSIKSLFCRATLSDSISYSLNDTNKIKIIDKKNILPENNLLKTAADKIISSLNGRIPFGIDFTVEKKIPIGGGLGGGSSNAASVLKILNKEWRLNFGVEKLKKIARQIGADVPFFIEGGTQKVFGVGEIVKSIKTGIPVFYLILVFPEIQVSTPAAYKLIDDNNMACESYEERKMFKKLIEGYRSNDYKKIISNVYNKFEYPVFAQNKILSDIKNDVLDSGADASVMSGSGSTIIGIYETYEKRKTGIERLQSYGYNVEPVEIF